MSNIFGNIQHLSPSQKKGLEKLANKKTDKDEFVDWELSKSASKLATQLNQQIALIISRDGVVNHVCLGTKNRVYLPDLGRQRFDKSKLRLLRLIVFLPNDQKFLRPRQLNVYAPEIAKDLITDLEKLRLDCVLVVAGSDSTLPAQVSLAYLSLHSQITDSFRASTNVSYAYSQSIQDLTPSLPELLEEVEETFRKSQQKATIIKPDSAILIGAYTQGLTESQASMEELKELTRTAGLEIVDIVVQRRKTLDPRTIIGKGKVEDIVLHALDLGAELLIFDRELAPGQLRTIASLTDLKVIDRSMLILDIFAQRAVSSEGRLQVELAQLKYSLPRLTETDSGLSRLSGGIGGRGPGETKLEIGRRRARDRITDLEKKITQLAKQRELRRDFRKNRGVPVIAIVGYTNAGKSTLLNNITNSDVLAENKLFATLDPATRRMRFPDNKEIVFVDTVGFIRELPKELVSAFRATLEEIGEADIILQLIDASSPEFNKHIEVINKTLENLGFGNKPRILVINKIDLISKVQLNTLIKAYGAIAISAANKEGFKALIKTIEKEIRKIPELC